MKKCNNPDCFIATTDLCYKMHDPPEECSDLSSGEQNVAITKDSTGRLSGSYLRAPWDGEYLTLDNIPIVTVSTSPTIIGLIGTAKAGKTSYLATLFTLLQNKKRIMDFNFSGSYTLNAWDKLAHSIKYNNGDVQYPEPTPSNPNFIALFHLRMKGETIRDILFADASGEVFGQWANDSNDVNAGSARWISANSNSFIFFIDSDMLAKRKAVAKSEILDIAYRLKDSIGDRPVVLAWSKGDVFMQLPRDLRQSLDTELMTIFNGPRHFKISNHSFSDSDELCHVNNIKVVETILSSRVHSYLDPLNYTGEGNDYFFKYGQSIG
jgi:hypothetical protein